MHHFHVGAPATAAVAAFALAACGSSNKPSANSGATVTVATTKLGKVVVDSKGMTLYRLDSDTAAGKSTCGAGPWPRRGPR
jgi:predicted lipoprotein with Yx(FWY)xxD motif